MAAPVEPQITLQFKNELKEPSFDFSISLRTNRAYTILELMEMAAWQDTTFKFAMEYYGSVPGYMVTGIAVNGGPFVFADKQHFWRIISGENKIPVGISAYQPKNDDVVLFELVPMPKTKNSSCG